MTTTNLNVWIFQWIHAGAGGHPVLDEFAVFFAEGGPYLVAALFVALWFIADRKKKIVLLEATEAALIGLMINQLIGLFYFHPRPYMVGLGTPLFPHGPETSFPSDHATLIFAAGFYLLIPRGWAACGIPLMTAAFLTAWGRVYAGIHFPLDMVGSLAVGLACAWMVSSLAASLLPLNDRFISFYMLIAARLASLKHLSDRNR
jgi:undecaprenyl-diphosphatase